MHDKQQKKNAFWLIILQCFSSRVNQQVCPRWMRCKLFTLFHEKCTNICTKKGPRSKFSGNLPGSFCAVLLTNPPTYRYGWIQYICRKLLSCQWVVIERVQCFKGDERGWTWSAVIVTASNSPLYYALCTFSEQAFSYASKNGRQCWSVGPLLWSRQRYLHNYLICNQVIVYTHSCTPFTFDDPWIAFMGCHQIPVSPVCYLWLF